jgi:hypothetical protein
VAVSCLKFKDFVNIPKCIIWVWKCRIPRRCQLQNGKEATGTSPKDWSGNTPKLTMYQDCIFKQFICLCLRGQRCKSEVIFFHLFEWKLGNRLLY